MACSQRQNEQQQQRCETDSPIGNGKIGSYDLVFHGVASSYDYSKVSASWREVSRAVL